MRTSLAFQLFRRRPSAVINVSTVQVEHVAGLMHLFCTAQIICTPAIVQHLADAKMLYRRIQSVPKRVAPKIGLADIESVGLIGFIATPYVEVMGDGMQPMNLRPSL